jgi:hypothetical protein
MAVADDLEGLHHGNAGGHHGGELAAEHRDVLGVTLPPDLNAEVWVLTRVAATPWRRRSARSAARSRQRFAAHLVAALVLAFPENWVSFLEAVAEIAIELSLQRMPNRW